MISPNIAGSVPPTISNGFALTWSGTSRAANSYVIVQMGKFNAAGDAFEEFVTCAFSDDGTATIPVNVFTTGWVSNRQVNLFVGNYRTSGTFIPELGGISEVAGMYSIAGATFMQ